MRPLLYLKSDEPLPAPESMDAVHAVVVDATEAAAASQLLSALAGRPRGTCGLLARIGPDGATSEADLGLLLASRIDGIVLAGCRGPAEIQRTDVLLKVAEAAARIKPGKTAMLVEYATRPESVLSPHALAGASPRLSALIFDASALAQACGLRRVTEAGDVPAVIRLARATAILRAREAGIVAYEMLPDEALDEWTVRRLWANSMENGFSAAALRSVQQIDLLAAATASLVD